MPVMLDGAQGAGAVPVDVMALSCAAYAAAGQKWLCGADGTGMLYVAPRVPRSQCAPIAPSYMSLRRRARSASTRRSRTTRAATTRPRSRARWSASQLASLERARAPRAGRVLAARARSPPRSPSGWREAGHTVAPRGDTTLVAWEDADPEATRAALAEAGIVIRNLPGTPYLRASVGAWNDASPTSSACSAPSSHPRRHGAASRAGAVEPRT